MDIKTSAKDTFKLNNGNTIPCIILYDTAYNTANGTNYGIQAISADSVQTFQIGIAGNEKASVAAWNSAIQDLNGIARSHLNTNYATAARTYFCIKENLPEPESAFNSCLAEEDRVVNWDEGLKQSYPNTGETAEFEEDFAGRNVNLQQAISIGLYYRNTDVTGAYYWTAADYVEDHESTGQAVVERSDSYVKVNVTGLYAYNIYDMYYVRSYNAKGDLGACYGASVASYLTVAIDTYKDDSSEESQALVALCKAMQVYGKNASTNSSINRPK